MGTSRTGTTLWKNLRARALFHAQQSGVTHCRYCRALLDYSNGLAPNAAVPDHIVPFSRGGKDKLDNLQVICRTCNLRLGNKTHIVPRKSVQVVREKVKAVW